MNDEKLRQNLNPVEQPEDLPVAENAPQAEQGEAETTVEEPREAAPAISSTEQNPTPAQRRPRRTTGPIISPVRDELVARIEKIMEDGVGDAFQRLSPIAKQELKIKGEQTAIKIRELLKATHLKVKKIFQLILEWMKLLPGVNRFFLEQEAKIKTDRIIALHKNQSEKT